MNKWIITCNPKLYDVFGAFDELSVVSWKQSTNIQAGDTVFIYVSSPISAIKFETVAEEVNLPTLPFDDFIFVIDGSNYESYGRYMTLRLVEEFGDTTLPYSLLKQNGLNSVQGPSMATDELERFIQHRKQLQFEDQNDNELIREITIEIDNSVDSKYIPHPVEKPEPRRNAGIQTYPRNRKAAVNALARASYSCEINKEHPSFIRRNSPIKYSEPHHLIPLSYQEEFLYSLDVEANIVSLCSNCHNQIHYGEGAEILIEQLYELRWHELEQAGLLITLEELLSMY